MANKEIKLEITEEKINQLIDEIENSNLSEESRDVLITTLKAVVRLDQLVGMKDATIAKLRKIFGKKSEALFKKDPKDKKEAVGTTGGSGRNGHKEFNQAKEIIHPFVNLKPQDTCPDCLKGKLYPKEPGVYLRIHGHMPLEAVIHKTEKLRCNLCGKIFEAEFDKEGDKYDPEAKAVLALLHYRASIPFYRQEKLLNDLGVPLARSTLWTKVEELADELFPIWRALVQTASGGDLFYIDDTKAKVLSLMLENELQKENKKHRSGMNTTGILSELNDLKIVLYFTGRKHSGENIKELLARTFDDKPITIMSDALKVNDIDLQREILKALCLVHGRRNFMDVEKQYQEEAEFVKTKIAIIYKNESHCKDNKLSGKERLAYHQEHSLPVMNELKKYLNDLFADKKVEPNSELGDAIKYMQKHWDGLTAFLRHPGVPIDNNTLEQKLRLPVLNRKNWLFYKNEHGAAVGDIFLTLIKTCEVNKVNTFNYFVEIQKNKEAARKNPMAWMPWNYIDAIPL